MVFLRSLSLCCGKRSVLFSVHRRSSCSLGGTHLHWIHRTNRTSSPQSKTETVWTRKSLRYTVKPGVHTSGGQISPGLLENFDKTSQAWGVSKLIKRVALNHHGGPVLARRPYVWPSCVCIHFLSILLSNSCGGCFHHRRSQQILSMLRICCDNVTELLSLWVNRATWKLYLCKDC